MTLRPARASQAAAVEPAGPPPATMTSQSNVPWRVCDPTRLRGRRSSAWPRYDLINPVLDSQPDLGAKRSIVRCPGYNNQPPGPSECCKYTSRVFWGSVDVCRAVNEQHRRLDARSGILRTDRVDVKASLLRCELKGFTNRRCGEEKWRTLGGDGAKFREGFCGHHRSEER